MKVNKYTLIFLLMCFHLTFTACSLFAPANALTPQAAKMLVGKWIMRSVKQGTDIIQAEKLGGEATLEFSKDGKVLVKLPGWVASNGQYYVEKNKIYDVASRRGEALDILNLTNEKMLIEIKVGTKKAQLTFEKTL